MDYLYYLKNEFELIVNEQNIYQLNHKIILNVNSLQLIY